MRSYGEEQDRNQSPSRSYEGSGAGLDTQEANNQHYSPGTDLEPAGEKEEKPAHK